MNEWLRDFKAVRYKNSATNCIFGVLQAATSYMISYFFELNNYDTYTIRSDYHLHGDIFRFFPPPKNISKTLHESLAFTIVRHPFRR